jgi:hypothetical protein
MEDEKVKQFFGVWACNMKMIFMVEEFVRQPPQKKWYFFFSRFCTILKRRHNVY